MAKRAAENVERREGEKLRRHIRILADLGRLAGESADFGHFLDQAVMQVARGIGIDHVKILQYRRAAADLLMVAGLGWKDGSVRSATFSSDLRSPPGRSFQTGEPVLITDTGHAPDFTISAFLKEHGIVSLANVPVLIDGAAWGVLEIDSTLPRAFGQDTIDFLTAAGAIIGSMVRRFAPERREAAALLEAAAEAHHREVLLGELQHRVKNNFQIILSSIAIQRRRFENVDTQRALDHVANRINAISLAHDQLAPGQKTQTVAVAAYLRTLCASIEQQAENVTISVEADEIELLIDRAVPLGLILNEVVTNSLKHAFGEEGGHVTVRLQGGVGYGEAKLTIADNGRGAGQPRTGGTGLKLVATLARQIGGDCEQESSSEGTTTTVVFPIIS